jgi:MFS family permease
MERKGKKIFYGWWIVAGGFILNFIGIGIALNALGVFFKPVVESQGFSRGDFSFYFTIAALAMTFAAPAVGKLMEKIDVRIIMGFSITLLGASFALYSQCSTLTHFYLLSILVGIGHGGSHIIPISTLINNWFTEKRGLAMGIVYSATGIGGLTFNPLGNWLISQYGWRSSYMILGACIVVVGLPVAVLIMRKSPQEMGLNPDGAAAASVPAAEGPGLTLGEFVKTRAFVMLALAIFFINTFNMGIQQHLIPYLTDIGHSSTFAANIMGLYLGMTVVGKLSLGQLTDRKGLTAGLLAFTVVIVGGMALLFGARAVYIAVLFGVVYGIGNAIQTVMPPLITAHCAGLRHFALIYGIMSVFQTLGSGVGMPLSGYLYDWRGDYYAAFAIYIALAVLAAIFGVMAIRRGGEKRP